MTFTSRRLFVGGCCLYAAVYLHYGITTPFLPVWYASKGFSADQVAALLSLPMFLKVGVVPPLMALADQKRRVRDMALICTAAAVVVVSTMNAVPNFWLMLMLTALFAVFWDTLPVLADAYCVSAARERSLDFGKMRLWGSLSFVCANLLAGWIISHLGVRWIVWIAALFLSFPLLVLPLLPPDRWFSGARPAETGEWRVLLKRRGLILMIISVSLIMSSHAVLNNFSSISWMKQRISESVVGALWATGIAAEAVVLFWGGKFLRKWSPEALVIIGGAVATIRWLIMSTNPRTEVLFLVQIMQGFSGISPILAMMIYIERHVPTHLIASAQGLYAPVWSGALALTTLGSGPLWRLCGSYAYWFMAAIASAAIFIAGLSIRFRAEPEQDKPRTHAAIVQID